jgi:hypothetical protein
MKTTIITIILSVSSLTVFSQTMDNIEYYKGGKKDTSITKIDIREIKSQFVSVEIKYQKLLKGLTPIKIKYGFGEEIKLWPNNHKNKSIVMYNGEIVIMSEPNDFINYFTAFNYELVNEERNHSEKRQEEGLIDIFSGVRGKKEYKLRFKNNNK